MRRQPPTPEGRQPVLLQTAARLVQGRATAAVGERSQFRRNVVGAGLAALELVTAVFIAGEDRRRSASFMECGRELTTHHQPYRH